MEQAGVQLVAQGSDAFGADMKAATKAVESFGTETKKAGDLVQDAAGRWRTASGRFASDAEKAAAGVETVAPAAKKAGDAAKQAGDDAEKGGRGFDAFGEIVTGALRKVGEMAVSALAEAAKATASFLKDSVGLAGDFEQGMLNFQAVAGKDVDTKGLEQFKDLFLSLGKELPVSTSEVQQAAIEMIKGGIDPAIVAAGGLKQNIQFAAAAMDGDLVAAAEVSSKILGGWADANATAQQKAEFLTHATDQLTKAANASSVDVHELSLGIFNAQGIAKTAGVSFDDLTTTLAALSPRFASSSEAGNSLKNVIARLQPQTKTAAGYMLDLGLITEEGGNKFYDAEGKFVGFQKASEILKTSLVGLTEQQKTLYLQQIFGNDAMNAAAGLADLGAAGYQNMADALDKANGVQENAALKQQGFNTALDNAKGSVEALQITIGSALLPVLTELLNDVVAPGVNILSELADGGKVTDATFSKLSPTMQQVATFAQEVFDGLKKGVAIVEDIGGQIQNLTKSFNQAGGAGDSLGGVINGLNGTWNKALQVVTDVGNGYLAIAQAILPIVSKFWEDHGTAITAFLKTAYDKIMSIVNVALDLYDAIVPKVLGSVAKWIEEHATGIQAVLSGAWQAISGIIDGALTLIEGVLKIALDVINGDWKKAWTDLQTMSATIVLDIQKVIEGFLNIIAGFFNTSLDGIVKVWQDNWDMLVEIASKVADRMLEVGRDIIQGIIDGIEGAAGSLFSTLKNIANDALQAAKDALGISSPSKEFAAIGVFAVQGLMQGFSETWPQLTDLVGSLSEKLIGQMQDIGGQMQDIIADSFGATASIDRQMAKNLDQIGNIEDAFTRKVVAQDLETLKKKAMDLFPDPKVAADYYKMVSNHEFETLKLRQQIAEASTQEEKDRLNQQLILISRAQDAELDQFYAAHQAQQSPTQQIVEQINEVMKALTGIRLTDDQQKIVDMLSSVWYALQNVPHRAQGGAVGAGQPYWVGEQGPELFWPQTNGMVSPAASSAQMARAANTTNYNGQVGNTFNMPIYTNNSPAAIQQSWAVLQASMP